METLLNALRPCNQYYLSQFKKQAVYASGPHIARRIWILGASWHNLLERFFAQAPPGVSLMDETNNQVGLSPDVSAFVQYAGWCGQGY